MRVVLTADVPGVGRKGSLVVVRPGYFRNFLEPQRLAEPATAAAIKRLEHRRRADKHRTAVSAAGLAATRAAVERATVTVTERAKDGKLYGSVTAERIAALVHDQLHQTITPDAVTLDHPIRTVGTHPVRLIIGGQSATLTVEIRDAA